MLDFVGRQMEKIRTRSMTKVGVVLSILVAVVTTLVAVPAEYHITAHGKLMPAVQRRVFAEFDGEVARLLVRPGDVVVPGTPLLQLTNEVMEDELLQLRSQRDERRKSLLSLNSQVHSASRSSDRQHLLHLQAEQEQCRIEISSLDSRIVLAEKQMDRMTLRAPIEGTVVTFVDAQQLIGKPVRRGDSLLEIMDENGPWRLELEVPEHRMHHLRHGIRSYGETVPARFKLTADPKHEFSGTLSHTAERSTLNAEEGAVVQVHISPDKSSDLPCRIGADVRSKLECGRYSLMYVLFGDAVEYAQREFWF
jgi:biotin carboxyl carrier protein